MALAQCPSCGAEIDVGESPDYGQRVACHACSEEMEIVWLYPIEFDWPLDNTEYLWEDDEDN